ncbi:MAG: DUF2442 domain-containing protein [bacterium]
MFIHVTKVEYAEEYRLLVTFDDGMVKRVDLASELSGQVFEPLLNRVFFGRAVVNPDTGTIEWPNGADFAPEFLYDIGEPVQLTPANKVAETSDEYRATSRSND